MRDASDGMRRTDSLTHIEQAMSLSLIHISEPTRQEAISYAVFCLKKKTSPSNAAVTSSARRPACSATSSRPSPRPSRVVVVNSISIPVVS